MLQFEMLNLCNEISVKRIEMNEMGSACGAYG